MATRKAAPPAPRPANLSTSQMREAIPKLERRIRDLEAFDPKKLTRRSDPSVEALEQKLTDTITEVFGHDTIEFGRFAPSGLDHAGWNMMSETPLYEVIASIAESKETELAKLRTIIELFNEKISDGGDSPATKAKRAFGDLDLEPSIAGACEGLFKDGHYSDAVETACKVLDSLVQVRSGKFNATGVPLMQSVFSPNNPVLKFNDQTNESEKSEQQGMMWLYSGAMAALRNPRAHGIVQDHPEQAVEYLSFISMLTKALSRTKR
jgi:uncharacterized protein (TIGR02391 family)